MKLVAIIGTRPQYVKHAPLDRFLREDGRFELVTVDTGQHYDNEMSRVFIEELDIQTIRYNLSIRSSKHGEQTGLMLARIEELLLEEQPDMVIVYGDTNSTLAGAIAASKLKIPIVHIEAGMRNFNLSVPEEINRVLTDRISTLKIAPSEAAQRNLENENLGENTYLFGDITTDLLFALKETTEKATTDFYYATVHRPYNTSEKSRLQELLAELNGLDLPVIFPMHPRTRNMMKEWNMDVSDYPNITIHKPFGFSESTQHVIQSTCVITDSGGVQKEAYMLGKRCISILPNTPWEETLEGGWNQLVFDDLTELCAATQRLPDASKYKENYYGDGHVSAKIADLIATWHKQRK